MKNSKFIKDSKQKYNISFDKIRGLSELKVEGTNLLNNEIDSINKMKKKKLLVNLGNNEFPSNEVYGMSYIATSYRSKSHFDVSNLVNMSSTLKASTSVTKT